jgi:hypothetical protein
MSGSKKTFHLMSTFHGIPTFSNLSMLYQLTGMWCYNCCGKSLLYLIGGNLNHECISVLCRLPACGLTTMRRMTLVFIKLVYRLNDLMVDRIFNDVIKRKKLTTGWTTERSGFESR